MRILDVPLAWVGTRLGRYLSRQVHIHGIAPETPRALLLEALRPGDVLLVEGRTRVSTAIKFLTQSTWSHAALFVGDHLAAAGGNPAHCFVEADIVEGVRSVGMDEFAGHHTRICRPVGLDEDACRQVTAYAIERIGDQYDLRNVFDLARYLFPTPPLPTRLRRRALKFGSGDPTRAICSTLIAQAFQAVRYPILPLLTRRDASSPQCPGCVAEVLHVRHHSLFAPRDFDVSVYFQIIKPSLAGAFDYRSLPWDEAQVIAHDTHTLHSVTG
ncbi:MAG: lipo-like protein [Proteobacteria bacterium]|nr:lipo-like protein [Pseudomonadota bacterium]